MKLKPVLLLTGLLLSAGSTFAQYAEDALRFSSANQGTSTRFRAMGGAQTAVGGDLGSLASNPAGLGLFTRHEISFTPDYSGSDISSVFGGSSLSATRNKLGVSQVGAVFNVPVVKRRGADVNTGAVSFTIGLGYNKNNNYNSDLKYAGQSTKNSFADYAADLSNAYLGNGNPGTSGNHDALPSGTLERMAYDNYLIEYDATGYFPTVGFSNQQQNTTLFTGQQSELNLAGAVNVENKLYLGFGFTFSNLNYGADREFMESGKTAAYTGQPADFNNATYTLAYRSNQNTTGNGFSAKMGVIYRASDNLRLGLSVFTPTWYMIDDNYSETLETRYVRSNGTAILPIYTNPATEYPASYTLRTPFRVNGGASMILPGIGLISGDVEYADYSTIHFSSDAASTETNVNKDISQRYQQALNARIGAEVKVSQLYLRGGYSQMGNPYQDRDYSSKTVSGGLGYRKNNFYTDICYANTTSKYSQRPYDITTDYPGYSVTGNAAIAGITDQRNNFYLTFGVRF